MGAENPAAARRHARACRGDTIRLPNIRELLSLIDYGFFQPALSNPAGTAQAPDVIDCPFSFLISPDLGLSYWSSTTRFASPVSAWHVELTEGNADVVNKAFPLASGVLAVRGQQGERDEQ
jgi:Protein of unknown function (DUF1566)